MEIFKIVGVGFVTAISAILLKQTKPELAFAVTIAGVIIVLMLAADMLEETLGDLKKYKEESFNLKNANNALKKENAFLKDEIQSLKIELAKNGKI